VNTIRPFAPGTTACAGPLVMAAMPSTPSAAANTATARPRARKSAKGSHLKAITDPDAIPIQPAKLPHCWTVRGEMFRSGSLPV
jgi:hypothetical protein